MQQGYPGRRRTAVRAGFGRTGEALFTRASHPPPTPSVPGSPPVHPMSQNLGRSCPRPSTGG
ncbi:hypothetical protein KPATCC21470_2848 [Kitasatospora purpeofusca]